MAVFLGLLAVILALIVYYVKSSFSYFEKHGFEYVKPEFPFGSLKGVGISIHFSQLSREFYNKYKNKAPAIGLYFFTSPVVFLIDLDLVKNVLVKDFNNFHDRGLYVSFFLHKAFIFSYLK